MLDKIGLNQAQFLQLDTNIRVSSNATFNAQDAFENAFEDVVSEIANKDEQQQTTSHKVNFSNLGAPAGFFLDTSLLSEQDKLELNSISLN